MERKVSVIIPVYNCKDYLSRAVDSVIAQNDFSEIEIILVDDGSTDGSADICDKYASEYANISVIHQTNSGVSVARNNGILKAQGEWIFFLDSDDYMLQDAFVNMLVHGDSDIICAKHDSNVSDLPDFEHCVSAGIHKISDIRDEMNWLLASSGQFFYTCWSKLFRRSLIIDNCIEFPEGQKYAEDMVFVYSYLRHCNTISLVKEKVYYYFVNEDNATSVVTNSFDVIFFIYNWKTDYFTNIDCDSEKIKLWLVSSFLFKAFFSIKTAAEYMSGFNAIRYINQILNNETFYSLYVNSDEYKHFKNKTDALLDRFIRRKSALMICFVFRINKIKSKLLFKIR